MHSFMTLLPIVLMFILSVGLIPVLIWMERRVSALIQNRYGPNRCNVGGIRLGGIVQSFADVIKLIFKEEFYPKHIKNRFIYLLAPSIVFAASFLTFAVIPMADHITIGNANYFFQALPSDLGMLWFVALAGISVYGIILAGWSSHNKFGMLGALRASAQMISYEIAMGLSIVSIILTYDSIYFNDMVTYQSQTFFGFLPAWGIVVQPLAALIFIVTAFAETNRAPFDVAEGESEIVAGYHTEYSAMKFALFFMGEYVAMNASAALIVTLFLGGYQLPWVGTSDLLANPDMTLMIAMAIVAGVLITLLRWMQKNNHRNVVVCNQRERETRLFTIVFIGMLGMTELILAGFYLYGIEHLGISVIVTLLQVTVFIIKLFLVNLFFVVVRWTFPRFRYDQIQHLGWYILLPLGLVNIFITAIIVVL